MNFASQPPISPSGAVQILLAHPRRWLVPAVVVALLAGAYALVRPATWEATQALIVRNEAANSRETPGKFDHTDEMKTVQETILELSRSRGVLGAALAEVGPAPGCPSVDRWPSAEDVADLRDRVRLTPPKGAEFGQTEVFYLNVRDHNADRAVALATAICDQLEAQFQQLRDAKAQSMIGELAKTVKLANADLAESTSRLTEIEKLTGRDLTELRILQDSNSGESVLRRTMTEIEGELRQVSSAREANGQLLALLATAQDDPGRLVALPNRLLESQPGLRRLKEGLIDAGLRTAQLQGRMSAEHPLVVAARESEREITSHLHSELGVAIRGIEVDLRLAAAREKMLQQRLTDATERLARLAAVRASYGNQVAENRHRGVLLQRAEENLAEAYAARASAKGTSLISRIDSPDVGIGPVGPGRATILLVGIAAGLVIGIGVLLLTVQPLQPAAPAPTILPEPTLHAPPPLSGSLSFKQALLKLAGTQSAWN